MCNKASPVFIGIATALVTPFKGDKIDFTSMGRLIDIQIECGANAIVICGTTGEAPTLSPREHSQCINFAVKRAKGRLPIIAGTGSNCTKNAVERSKAAESLGADALLIVTPYYNKASPDGLIRHYEAVSDSVSVPIILYNVPSRTGLDIPFEVYRALSQYPNIVGVKEASARPDTALRLRAELPDFQLYSGNDDMLLDMLEIGALGCISVASNIIPRQMCSACDKFFGGDISGAKEVYRSLAPLFKALFCEVNPIPVKYAMELMGLCSSSLRLPLCEPSQESKDLLRAVLTDRRLISK